ncbi:hypothetical protein [Oceanospirillum sediminis]|uniref:Uncharacterized protein n=1 Tax=Oceanospirillum sediminis TaxID=2760088 RepID=A0A839IV25_9GAMM|nr:hypothetical protein [Oceanospirillum sediminis]MBB1488808.1 hypothetical protein [Oceanospirillum sediminis]
MNTARVIPGYEDQPDPLRHDAVRVIAFHDQIFQVEQILFQVREFRVFELKDKACLSSRSMKYLAVTKDNQLYSIDILNGPKNLLAEHLGKARVMWF